LSPNLRHGRCDGCYLAVLHMRRKQEGISICACSLCITCAKLIIVPQTKINELRSRMHRHAQASADTLVRCPAFDRSEAARPRGPSPADTPGQVTTLTARTKRSRCRVQFPHSATAKAPAVRPAPPKSVSTGILRGNNISHMPMTSLDGAFRNLYWIDHNHQPDRSAPPTGQSRTRRNLNPCGPAKSDAPTSPGAPTTATHRPRGI
jgi:hypothetical protein